MRCKLTPLVLQSQNPTRRSQSPNCFASEASTKQSCVFFFVKLYLCFVRREAEPTSNEVTYVHPVVTASAPDCAMLLCNQEESIS